MRSRSPSRTEAISACFFGFFVCGFHVAFIQTHLPAYVGDRGLAAQVGGRLYDIYQDYSAVWWMAVALGLAAAVIHLPIKEEPGVLAKAEA